MLIAQSGGPSSAINASITGAIARGMASSQIDNVLGAVNGMQGFLDRKIINISEQMKTSDDFRLLTHTPAHALRSSRYKIKSGDEETYKRIVDILKEFNIKYFFYNGGNDSMDTVYQLSEYLKKTGENIVALGIPKTIDNDLELTDHTPGFGSAARYVATSVAELYLDTCVYPQPACTVVEIMGRNAGWLTAASALARETGLPAPHLIYLPEVGFDPDAFILTVRETLERDDHILIAVSEGLHTADGKYLSDTGAAEDMFGHKTLGGAANVLEKLIKQNISIPNLKTRAIQFSTLQRAAAHCASFTDLDEAYQCGYRAVELAVNGKSGLMVTIARISNVPYVVRYDEGDLSQIANKEKKVPLEWITKDGTDVSEEMLVYLRPLVTRPTSGQQAFGLPKYFTFDINRIVTPRDVK